ncbi:acyl-CoA thioesterase/bile acid-CoA:amino acid N-acyltransferase family protein [Leifsonia poae]|uniref:acyl-CoA thioesterase/bile acid-CoA:amino acid N-acyltransferase family protein n=1 Tax=Leifsonia poae TaxID=110933 RepID=UPI001CBD1A6C|nr:acyl-CoA thioesterase/BAAT N-terminal domain-containing protein [Leifsonia poae]
MLGAAGALVVVALALSGCTAGTGTGVEVGPRFVSPPFLRYSSVLWPSPLELVGAEPGSRLRLVATLPTPRGVWSSSATYTVPPSGTVDLAAEHPQFAPFAVPDSAGLFWSLRGPRLGQAESVELWMRSAAVVTVNAFAEGRRIAHRVFVLDGLAENLRQNTVTVNDLGAAVGGGAAAPHPGADPPETHADGPVGTFYGATPSNGPRSPAVVVFDDAADGASADYVAPVLVAFGASVFVLPVARDAGGVRVDGSVDSSTFGAVLDWLAARPDIDPRQVFTYGTAQSEQLALWAAARFAPRVRGVFAAGGSTALLCRAGGRVSPAFDGGVGESCQRGEALTGTSAVLSLAAVPGPVVLACGGADAVLVDACAWQHAAEQLRGPRVGDVLIRSDAASHAVSVPPGLPLALPPMGAQQTEMARVAFWNAIAETLVTAERS